MLRPDRSTAGSPLPRCYPGQIPVGILLASEQVRADVAGVLFLGELSLDSALRHLPVVLPIVGLARDCGIRTVYVLAVDVATSTPVGSSGVIPVATLAEPVIPHRASSLGLKPRGDDHPTSRSVHFRVTM